MSFGREFNASRKQAAHAHPATAICAAGTQNFSYSTRDLKSFFPYSIQGLFCFILSNH